MIEGQRIEKKSLKLVVGSSSNFEELAKDCVCFANARGGVIHIGIEDEDSLPDVAQKIDTNLPDKIRKRISELTINVGTNTNIKIASNDGEYIELIVLPSSYTIASTTDGKYYLRVSDTCAPLPPDELLRLVNDKPSFIWETKQTKVKRNVFDKNNLQLFVKDLNASDRVSAFIKQMSNDEILDYYLFTDGDYLTNLGVLWIGHRNDRAKLSYAPVVQFLKFDENENRVNKIVWDDYSLNPKQLLEAIWTQIPDWKEGIEVSDGIFRKFVANYEEEVIRELIANALVHRPYTTRGDIFVNLYSDRLEIHNPGRFPIGVTAENILHKTVKRNEHLAKVFYDLKLMEREGSGYDKMYETLLSNGKQVPIPFEGDDRVSVTIKKHIIKTEIVKFISRANEEFQLRQKEIICLGLIAQNTMLSATEFSRVLNLPQPNAMRDWLGRLQELGLVISKGKTKGVEYFIGENLLNKLNFKGKTSLKKIENHRLRELIYQDILAYPQSSISEIQQRIGNEIPYRKIKAQLYSQVENSEIMAEGKLKGTRYFIDKKL